MTTKRDRFGTSDISVTLTGEEWFAWLARTVGRPLSVDGARAYNRAQSKVRDQLVAASDRIVGQPNPIKKPAA